MSEDLSFPMWVKQGPRSYLMEPAETQESAEYVQDEKGELILMKYIGPLPPLQKNRGKLLNVVSHSNSTSVHPAEKYSKQQYSRLPLKPAKYYSLD